MVDKLNEQEEFWKNNFGNEYFSRKNNNHSSVEKRTSEFEIYLKSTENITSVLEFGANIGLNLMVLKSLIPDLSLNAVEINLSAVQELQKIVPKENIYTGSFTEFTSKKKFDLVISRGVLIHLNPDDLEKAYKQLYDYSNKYILISEYFNPTPVSVEYRGFQNKLFKRDFCREILNLYNDLVLIDYGFLYSSDKNYKYDDVNWFLLEKN